MAPWFAVNMPDIDFDDIYYYLKPAGEQVDEWARRVLRTSIHAAFFSWRPRSSPSTSHAAGTPLRPCSAAPAGCTVRDGTT
jgi:hypothetical protein